MIVYILAIPVFSFFIPLYAFWHFDDFSWGNTRIVVGDKGKKKAVGPEEGKFDPDTIPTKYWSEYEQEMLEEWQENQSNCSKHSRGTDCFCMEDQHTHCSSIPSESSSTSVRSRLDDNNMVESTYSQSNTTTAAAPIPLTSHPMQMNRGETQSVHGFYDPAIPLGPLYFQGPIFPKASSTQSFIVMPNDMLIIQEVEKILDSHDLKKLTKKQVRDTLSHIFGLDMTCKKEFINRCIEQSLAVRI